MAVTTTNLANPIGAKIIIDTDADGTAEQAAISGAATIYQIRIDNTLNTVAVYLKIADSLTASAGTTEPHHIYQCPASAKISFIINSGLGLASGLSFWGTTDSGSNGSTSPANNVEVRFLAS